VAHQLVVAKGVVEEAEAHDDVEPPAAAGEPLEDVSGDETVPLALDPEVSRLAFAFATSSGRPSMPTT
jgi:hypothetical protein